MTDRVTETLAVEGITLLGYIQEQRKVNMAEGWTLTLFWRADRDAPAGARRDLLLIDEESGEALRLSGTPGGLPATEWMAGEIVRDPIAVPPAVDSGVAPARYLLALEVFSDTETRRPATMVIGKVKVRDR
jgi:hypothetical protein